ncbi:MAG: glycosyltransferase [Clostridiales bacterium]|nr:glycosyltransferase [Clostridiales bacterium]
MRIFQLNTFCGIKSTGRITTEIAKLVAADGGECLIGYGAGEVPSELEYYAYRIGTPIERKIHGGMRKLFDAEGYGSHIGTKQLISKMNQFKPQLVHLHNIHGCYLNHEMLFQYLNDIAVPVVWTLHDCWSFTGHCAYFDYAQCDKWQTHCHHCPQQSSYPINIGLDGSSRNYHHKKRMFTKLKNLTFVPPCEWMKEPLSKSFMSDYEVRTIVNGVNLAVFKPSENDIRKRYHIDRKHIVLSAASEWDARKGLRYLLEASKQLGDDYQFVVIGLSGEQVKALPSDFIGITHTDSTEDLVAWYTAADCFANPTMEDNMPMVNLEALGCGTPIAVFRTGGCPEAVDESCGIVVDKEDVPSLAQAIETLCHSSHKMQADCLKRSKLFDSEKTFLAYLDLYKELCK